MVVLVFKLNKGGRTSFCNGDMQPTLALECIHPILVTLLALGFPFFRLVLVGILLRTVIHKAGGRCLLVVISALIAKLTVSQIIH